MKIRISFLVIIAVFLNSQLFAQESAGGSQTSVLVLPSNESFNVEVPDKTCMQEGERAGCSAVVLEVPDQLTVEYSRESISSIPYSNRQYLSITSDGNYYSVIIPENGIRVVFRSEGNVEVLQPHFFHMSETRGVEYFRIQLGGSTLANIKNENTGGIALENQGKRSERDFTNKDISKVETSDPDNTQVPEIANSTGSLIVSTDVNANVTLNGEEIEQDKELTIKPGKYEVRIEHPLGEREETVEIKENNIVRIHETLRPSKAKAFAYGLLPGGGHLYKQQKRGYLYILGAIAGGLGIANWHGKFQEVQDDLDVALSTYRFASSVDEARFARRRVEEIKVQRDEEFDKRTYAIIGTAVIYGISILDNILTKPAYGYQNSSNSEGVELSMTSIKGFGLSPSLKLSYTW